MNEEFEKSVVISHERQSLISLSIVLAGVPLCVSGLLAGAALSESHTLSESIAAVVVGAAIVTVFGGIIGAIGAEQGRTTTSLTKECFGNAGATIVALVLAVCLTGWYAVQTGFFGQTIHELFPRGGILTTEKGAALWGGLLMLTTALYGYRGLKTLSIVAVPLITLLSIWGVYAAVSQVDLWSVNPKKSGSIGDGVTLIVGAFAVGATVNADLMRYAKSMKHAWIASFIGFFVANIFILISGAVTALATGGNGDLIAAMSALGLGAPALLILVLGQWTTNDNNLFYASSNLGSAFPKASKSVIVVACGILATLCGVSGIADSFVPFLIWLGVLIPPIGGVIIAHHYFCARRSISVTVRSFSTAAFAAWATGSLIGSLVEVGIPALNSIISAFLAYIVLKHVGKKGS